MKNELEVIRSILYSSASMIVVSRCFDQKSLLVNKEILEETDLKISLLFNLGGSGITFENIDDLLNEIKLFEL